MTTDHENVIDYSRYIGQLGAMNGPVELPALRGLSAPGLKRADNARGLPESRAPCCQLQTLLEMQKYRLLT